MPCSRQTATPIFHMRQFNKMKSSERNFVNSQMRKKWRIFVMVIDASANKNSDKCVCCQASQYSFTIFEVCSLHCMICIESFVHNRIAINCHALLPSLDTWVDRKMAPIQLKVTRGTKRTLGWERKKEQTRNHIRLTFHVYHLTPNRLWTFLLHAITQLFHQWHIARKKHFFFLLFSIAKCRGTFTPTDLQSENSFCCRRRLVGQERKNSMRIPTLFSIEKVSRVVNLIHFDCITSNELDYIPFAVWPSWAGSIHRCTHKLFAGTFYTTNNYLWTICNLIGECTYTWRVGFLQNLFLGFQSEGHSEFHELIVWLINLIFCSEPLPRPSGG